MNCSDVCFSDLFSDLISNLFSDLFNDSFSYIFNVWFFSLSQMVAKGKDASDLFPAVVKNVVSKNIEVSGVDLVSNTVNILLERNMVVVHLNPFGAKR